MIEKYTDRQMEIHREDVRDIESEVSSASFVASSAKTEQFIGASSSSIHITNLTKQGITKQAASENAQAHVSTQTRSL